MVRSPTSDIFNTDQGSQFTRFAFTNTLKDAGIRISMDGRGLWMDNVFIERLWRSIKYECVFLNAFETYLIDITPVSVLTRSWPAIRLNRLGKRCTGLSPRSANRNHQFTLDTWWSSSPLRAGLDFRYTQRSCNTLWDFLPK